MAAKNGKPKASGPVSPARNRAPFSPGPGNQAPGPELRALLERLPVGYYRSTPSGACLDANPALLSMLGCGELAELLSADMADFYRLPGERERHLARLDASEIDYEEFNLVGRGGAELWVRDFPRPVRDSGGKIAFIDGIMVDITESKRTEEALRRSEREYRQLFEKAHDAIVVFAAEGETILDVNDSACRLYGLDRRELVGMSLEALSKDVQLGKERIARLMEAAEARTFETTHFRKDGSELRLEINAALVSWQGREAIVSINHDITDRTRRMEDLSRLALYDQLTGVANRALLEDHLALAIAHASHSGAVFALIFLDLDGFKAVNDSFGHAAGDEVLRSAAGRLTDQLRRGDTVARFGGDEFVVLLPELAAPGDAEEVARKILAALREPFRAASRTARVTASLGLALYPESGRTATDLLRAADRAMYEAKIAGKDSFRRAQGSPAAGAAAGQA